MGNIITRKNAFECYSQSSKNKISKISNTTKEKENNTNLDVQDSQTHYYGSIKSISKNNDISYLCRGSIYFLKDHTSNQYSTYHPYIVIQTRYLDKIGKVAVFGITSTPSYINMIPIIMKGTIGYIDPHQPYYYRVTDFFEKGTRYAGTLVNQKIFDLITDMYGLYLGMNLSRSEEDIIADYNAYVEDFKERSKSLKPYKHKILKDNNLDKELHISFKINNDEEPEDDDDIIDDQELIDESTSEINENDHETHIEQNEAIIIEKDNCTVMSMIGILECKPVNSVKLPRHVLDMTIDEITVFLTYLKLNGAEETALLYNCSTHTIQRKSKILHDHYNIIYS